MFVYFVYFLTAVFIFLTYAFTVKLVDFLVNYFEGIVERNDSVFMKRIIAIPLFFLHFLKLSREGSFLKRIGSGVIVVVYTAVLAFLLYGILHFVDPKGKIAFILFDISGIYFIYQIVGVFIDVLTLNFFHSSSKNGIKRGTKTESEEVLSSFTEKDKDQ